MSPQYMSAVRLLVEDGAYPIEDSFNIGAYLGWPTHVDGIWSGVDGDSFIEPTYFIQENDIGGGRVRIDFNLTPVGGHEVTTGGALFNFELSFSEPGTYTLGFEEFHDVKRTYYSDGAADGETTEHNWADISNDYSGVPNTITVVAP